MSHKLKRLNQGNLNCPISFHTMNALLNQVMPPNSSLFRERPTNFELSDLISAELKSENIVVRPNLLFFERDFFVRLRNNQLWNSWHRAAENIHFFLQMNLYHVTLVIRLFFAIIDIGFRYDVWVSFRMEI